VSSTEQLHTAMGYQQRMTDLCSFEVADMKATPQRRRTPMQRHPKTIDLKYQKM
jgi:hypothetical protein